MHDAGIAIGWCPLLATACFASVLLVRSVCVSYLFVYLFIYLFGCFVNFFFKMLLVLHLSFDSFHIAHI